MTASGPTIRIGMADHDLNRALLDGTVKVEGYELDIAHGENDGEIHQLLRDEKIDACEYSFGTYMLDRARNVPFIAIPAFPNRKFRLQYIFINTAAGIETPKDLEGKRVGILLWNNTAGVWARGALQHHYGVDLTRIKWFTGGKGATPPAGISIESIPPGQLDRLLTEGELDAVIQADVIPSIQNKDPRVRRLFVDFKTEEQSYFKATGIFPISHMVTFPVPFVEKHPDAPIALLKAFRKSRDEAFHRLGDAQVMSLPWAMSLLEEQRQLMGRDYWAYNVENNRRPLEAMMDFAYEQGITPERRSVDTLFVPEAAALPGW